MRFFSYDSQFGRLFLKLSYACCLNVLWLVCCLPVFTIGASTTALYYTSFKIAKDEGSFITTMFFRSFRQNFKQATVIWLIMLGAGLLIAADAVVLYRLREASTGTPAILWTLLLAVVFASMIAYIIELMYIFPLLSIASNTTVNMFKNSFLIGTHYLFITILVAFIHYAMFFLIVNVFTPFLIFGEGLCAVISAHLLLKIFRPLLYDPNAGMVGKFEQPDAPETGLVNKPGYPAAGTAAESEYPDMPETETVIKPEYPNVPEAEPVNKPEDPDAPDPAGREGDP